MKRTLAAIAALAMLAGCSDPPTEGVVHDKKHHDAWLEMRPISTGKTTTLIPIQHPATWSLWVCERGATNDDDCGWTDVSESTWADIEVGDYWKEQP